MSPRENMRRRDKLFVVALIAGLTCAGYAAFEYRKMFIQSFFPRGPGQTRAVVLPTKSSAERRVRPTERVRVALLDGVGKSVAAGLRHYGALCDRGLDLTVDVGFPTVSLPIQSVLWTGLTQQQTGIQYVWKQLDPPLDGIGAAVSSTAVAEDYPFIIHSLGFDQLLPPEPTFAEAADKKQWMEAEFEPAALAAIESDVPLAFVHILRVDTAGHEHGPDSEPYRSAAASADALLGRLVTARPPDDDTLWLVLADHGHIRGGGHAGSEPSIRLVRACIAGGGVGTGRVERAIHLVDVYRVLETALDVATELDSSGRSLAVALTAPDSTGALLPTPGGRWAPALLILVCAIFAGLIASRWQLWGIPLWFGIAYASVALIEGVPTLSQPMIYKPLGQAMYIAAVPGLIALAVTAGATLRNRPPGRVTVALLAMPLSMAVAGRVLCHGEPPLMPVWTAQTSLALTLLATSCWVVALAHLVVSVPRAFGPGMVEETSRTDS